MPKSETFHTTDAPPAIGPYSQAIAPTVPGRPVYLSGQSGRKPDSVSVRNLAGVRVEEQTEQAFANIKAVLLKIRLNLSNVLNVTVYLTDTLDYSAMNQVYEKQFGDHRPARTTCVVAQLPVSGSKVEIQVIAWEPKDQALPSSSDFQI